MKGELFALGVADAMEKMAMKHESAHGTMIPAKQTTSGAPTGTAKSKGGPAKSEAKRGPFGKTHQAGMGPNGALSGENPNT